MIWSVGLQEDHLNEGFFSNTCKTNCATTLRTNLKWTFSSKVWKYLYFNQIYCLFKLTFSSRGITLVLKMLAFWTDGQQHTFGHSTNIIYFWRALTSTSPFFMNKKVDLFVIRLLIIMQHCSYWPYCCS